MAIKRHSKVLRSSELEPDHEMQFKTILRANFFEGGSYCTARGYIHHILIPVDRVNDA